MTATGGKNHRCVPSLTMPLLIVVPIAPVSITGVVELVATARAIPLMATFRESASLKASTGLKEL
ncbi:hypothetical protein D3C75_1273260 [compost metagenome]